MRLHISKRVMHAGVLLLGTVSVAKAAVLCVLCDSTEVEDWIKLWAILKQIITKNKYIKIKYMHA